MFERVIVPLDGSAASEAALDVAMPFAAANGGGLVVVSSCEPNRRGAVESYLRTTVRHLDIPDVTSEVLVGDDPAEAIASYARRMAPALVCIASHARRPVTEAVFGSVASALVQARPGPVVIAGPKYKRPHSSRYSDVLVPLDGSDLAAEALPLAIAMASTLGATLRLIEVTSPRLVEAAERAGIPRDDVYESSELVRVARDLSGDGVTAQWEVLHGSQVGATVTRYAGEFPAPLVVMSTHGRTGMAKVTAGSVASSIVHAATCPVMVVRPIGVERALKSPIGVA